MMVVRGREVFDKIYMIMFSDKWLLSIVRVGMIWAGRYEQMTYMHRMDGDLNLEVVLLKRHDQWMKNIVSEFLFYFSFPFLSFQTPHNRAAPASRISYHTDNYDGNLYSTYFTFFPYIKRPVMDGWLHLSRSRYLRETKFVLYE